MAAYYTYNFLPPVSSDFDSLLHEFEQESNHDYQSFANVWQKHKLELLFKSADIQPNSFRFFLDDSLTVAAAYLGEPWRLPIQLGALYCIFTIYMYQLEEPKVKVRITMETWNSLLDQMESLTAMPPDAKVILSKLIDENAFVISATRHEMGPRFFTKINYMKSGKYMRSDVLLSSRLNIDEKLIKICEETHNLYMKAKENLIEAYGGINNLPQELTSIRPSFIEQLKANFNLEQSTKLEQSEPQLESEPETTAPTRSLIGETRNRIRAKAEMSTRTKTRTFTKPTTHVTKEDNDEIEDDDNFDRIMNLDDMRHNDNVQSNSSRKKASSSKAPSRRSRKK